MAPKAEKLGQSIENLQLFLKKKSAEYEEFEAIALELEKLNTHLEQKKLTIQIVSQNSVLAQALFDLIDSNKQLLESYKLKFDSLPEVPKQITPQQFYSLKLQRLQDNSTDFQLCYELISGQEHSIGRNPDCSIILEAETYKGVSWNHAMVKCSHSENNSEIWEICDFNSTNGTFVNGERIQDFRVLQPGDKITLGYPQASQKTAELTFDVQVSVADTEMEQPYWEIIDCDLLFLVVDSSKALSQEEQEFIKNFDSTLMAKQFLVVELPDNQEQEKTSIKTNLADIEKWVKNEASDSGLEIVSLFLQPYYDEEKSKELESHFQKKQDSFFKSLENIVKRQPENILAKRLAIKIVRDLEPVDIALQRHQEKLSQTISQEKNELETLTQVNLKEITKKAITSVNEDKDKFFKQVKFELVQSKAALLDNFSKRSIVYRVQDFVDNLKPNVLTKQGHKYIQLKNEHSPESKDINTSLIDFCTSSLEKWANEEWDKICNVYGNGGLNGLLERAYASVNIIPSTQSESPFSSPQSIDVRNNFLISFAPVSCEVRHKQISLGAYIMKQLRSQMMQTMMMITLVLSLVGIQASKTLLMGKLSGVFKQLPWLFGLIIFGIIFMLINAYNKDDNLKLEEAGQKLKKDLAGYYQSFTKNMLEKVIQDLNLALESEDLRIANALDITNDRYKEHILETEKKQIKIKSNIEKYKLQQDALKKELSEFKKLKRL